MKNQVFAISSERIRARRRTVYLVMAFASLVVLIFAYLLTGGEGGPTRRSFTYVAFFSLLLTSIVIFLTATFSLRGLDKLCVVISDKYVKRVHGDYVEKIPFAAVDSVYAKRKRSGELEYLRLGANGKNLTISGFENMDKLYRAVADQIKPEKIIEGQYDKVYHNSNVIAIATASFVFVLIAAGLKFGFYRPLNIGLTLGVGAFYLFGKPLSKSFGQRYKKYDIISSIVLFVCMLAALAGYFVA